MHSLQPTVKNIQLRCQQIEFNFGDCGRWPDLKVIPLLRTAWPLGCGIQTMVKDVSAEHLSGVAMGLTNMAIMGIGAMMFQPLIGILAHSRGQEVPGATTLSVIILAQLLALAVLLAGRSRVARSE